MIPLFASKELTRRIELAEGEYFAARASALQQLPGNPYGASIKRFGGAIGLAAAKLPNGMWNRVLAMTSSDIEYLPSIAEWYERQGVAWGVDVAPSDDVGTLLSSLLARGLAHVGFYTAMFGRAATPAGSIGGERNHLSFDVRWMQPQADESEEYISCFLEGHSLPVDDHTALRIGLRGLLGNPIFQWVGAWAGSQLASMGILMISDGIAYVATTATRPQFRRQGLQRILGMVRRERALSLGCQVIALHTAVGSAIQRGNDLLDYRVAYTKAIWRYREI